MVAPSTSTTEHLHHELLLARREALAILRRVMQGTTNAPTPDQLKAAIAILRLPRHIAAPSPAAGTEEPPPEPPRPRTPAPPASEGDRVPMAPVTSTHAPPPPVGHPCAHLDDKPRHASPAVRPLAAATSPAARLLSRAGASP